MGDRTGGSKWLKRVWIGGGLLATGAGLHSMLAGLRSVPGDPDGDPGADSELRFYSAFYAAQGVRMLRAAAAGGPDSSHVNELAGTVLLAGLSRCLSWRQAGRPHPGQIALTAVELILPPVIVGLKGSR